MDITKKRAYEAIVVVSGELGNIATQFIEHNKIATKSADAMDEQNRISTEKNRLQQQGQEIQLAQALGDQAMLRSILSRIAAP